MSLWIKICGNTSLPDAQLAVNAGADAVGFIFASSPRRVTPEQVAAITPDLPASIEKIGVFVDADFDAIAATVELCGLSGVQLHSDSAAGLVSRLRERFGSQLRILQVIHFDAAAAEKLATASTANQINANQIDAILVDSRTATAVGGTGISFDWMAARQSIFTPQSRMKLIAAGGLSPANVAQAIGILDPWGVDAVSGVELSPGIKDPAKVSAFVEAARTANSNR